MVAEKTPKSRYGVSRRTFVEAAALGAAAWPLARAQVLDVTEAEPFTADEALSMARNRRDELLELLSHLVSIRSQSGETAASAQSVVKEYLAGLPYDVEDAADRPSLFTEHAEFTPPDPPGDGPFVNVVGRPRAEPGSQLVLFAHIDSHLVEGGWNTDPYMAVSDSGRLYGLGTADDKGGVAAMLVAVAALSDSGGPTPIVISHHGKGGGSRGSLPVFERMKDSGEQVDAVLYVHPAETGRGLDNIKHVVRGALDVVMTVDGWQGEQLEIGLPDSALWADGGDALEVCWQAITLLRDGVLRSSEVNVGRLEAGDRTGSVADNARADIRILFDGAHTWRGLMESMRSELDSFSAGLPQGRGRFDISIDTAGTHSNPGAVAWDDTWCQVLRHSIEDVTGRAPVSYPNHYGGDIRFPIRLLGKPAFGIGSIAGNFYGPNEWVDIDDLVRLVAILILTVSRWASIR